MRKARGRRYAAATALSLVAHAAVVYVLWLHAPKLVIPHEDAGPPEPIIPVLILPRTPPPRPGSHEPPRPIRLHRRQLHPEMGPPPEVPPLVAVKAPPPPAAPPAGRSPVQPRITVQPSPRSQLSAVLRGSPIGCANPALLTREERDRCLARLGSGAAEAPYLPPGMSREKQTALDAAAARSDQAVRQGEAGIPTGVAQPGGDSGASNRNKPLYAPSPTPLRP
jgi:hypothetical protein